jgi:hypothetical protein
MRGIERVIAGILLAAAICGSAAFARGIGGEPGGAGDVQLTAAPPQHALSSNAVRIPVYSLFPDREIASAPAKKPAPKVTLVARPMPVSVPAAPPARVATRKPAPEAVRRAPRATVAPAPPAPAPPVPVHPATPTPQSDSRILAKVPLTPTPAWTHAKGIGHGKLKNRADDAGAAAPVQPQQQQQSPAPQPTSPTVVVLSPAPQASGDNGNGHGHAYGRLKQNSDDHD